MKLLFCAVETGGLDPKKSALLQLSGIIVIDGEEKQRFNYFMQPFTFDEVNDEALKVNGITRERIASFSASHDVYRQFVSLLKKYVNRFDKTDKFFLVGYNCHSFDMPFLRSWFEKNDNIFFYPSVDVMLSLSHILMKRRSSMTSFKLMDVAKHLGFEIDSNKLHDAMYDIEITNVLYRHIIQAPWGII